MNIITSPSAWLRARAELQGSAGFVPTMGGLHEGHASLLRRSRLENDISLLSIFVNPTQFDKADDLARYPRTLESDLELARACGVDLVFAPHSEQGLYPDEYRFRLQEQRDSKILCGASRPGHFDGVLTVVLKLLELADADRAYFGEKDFQQLTLIQDMARGFFLPTQIVGCPIVRDADGLALSSRNVRLSQSGRILAARFASALGRATTLADARQSIGALTSDGLVVDYIESWRSRLLAAVLVDGVRLIDNVPERAA